MKYDPRLIVHGIPSWMTKDEIRSELIAQNLSDAKEAHLGVVYIYPVKQERRTTSCVIEVSPETRKVLIKNGRIYLRFSS